MLRPGGERYPFSDRQDADHLALHDEPPAFKISRQNIRLGHLELIQQRMVEHSIFDQKSRRPPRGIDGGGQAHQAD